MAKGDLSTTTAAWRSLNLYLPTRTHDEDYWWQKSGPQLAALVEGAGYTLAKQYEALLFHYHWMVCHRQRTRTYPIDATPGALHGPFAPTRRCGEAVEVASAA